MQNAEPRITITAAADLPNLVAGASIDLTQVAVAMHAPLLDLVAALAIALFIGWTAYQVISRSVRVLVPSSGTVRPEQVNSTGGRNDSTPSTTGSVFDHAGPQLSSAEPTWTSTAPVSMSSGSVKRRSWITTRGTRTCGPDSKYPSVASGRSGLAVS